MQLVSKLQLALGDLNNLLKEAVADFLLNLGDPVVRISIIILSCVDLVDELVSLESGLVLPLHLLEEEVGLAGSLGGMLKHLVKRGLFLRGAGCSVGVWPVEFHTIPSKTMRVICAVFSLDTNIAKGSRGLFESSETLGFGGDQLIHALLPGLKAGGDLRLDNLQAMTSGRLSSLAVCGCLGEGLELLQGLVIEVDQSRAGVRVSD